MGGRRREEIGNGRRRRVVVCIYIVFAATAMWAKVGGRVG